MHATKNECEAKVGEKGPNSSIAKGHKNQCEVKVRTGVLIPGLARGLIKLNECKRPGDQFLHGGLTTVSARGTQNRVRSQGERRGSNFFRASKGDTQK